MGWDVTAYWVCFITGVVYAGISALLGGLFGFGDHGLEAGGVPHGHDFGTSHDAAGGHGEAAAGGLAEEAAIAPLSPMTIAVFSTVFGGTGLILTKMFDLSIYVTIPSALGAGLLVAAITFFVVGKMLISVQASSEVQMGALVGICGEVTVGIPTEGVGEVAYVTLGGRYTSTARSSKGEAIDRHVAVRIDRVVGNTIYVSPADSGAEPVERPARPD